MSLFTKKLLIFTFFRAVRYFGKKGHNRTKLTEAKSAMYRSHNRKLIFCKNMQRPSALHDPFR
jgi:hypothetical protein